MTLNEALQKLEAMRSLAKNWDSYGNAPPNDWSIEEAKKFLDAAEGFMPDRVSPTCMEGVAMTWYDSEHHHQAFVEFYNSGKVYYLLSDDRTHDMQTGQIHDRREAVMRCKQWCLKFS